MNTRISESSDTASRLVTLVALVPLAYWFVVTAYALFFFSIAPWWALPLAAGALAIQLKGFALAKSQSAEPRAWSREKAMLAYAAGSWTITALFIVLTWK